MLLVHLAALALIAGTVVAGRWQYGVWQGHRVDQATKLEHAAPRPLTDVLGPDAAFPADAVGQPVTFTGRWMPEDTMYVAHRRLHGRAGVWAVTPVAVCRGGCAGASAILVVRGFAPTPRAAPPAPSGRARVTGWLQPGEGNEAPDPSPHDAVIPRPSVVNAIPLVARDLYAGYVIARTAGAGPAGLAAVTPSALPHPGALTGLRNLLYAFQWWLFTGFVVFLWWRFCRDETSRR